ncbi:MAG: peptidase [Clostridia bacterium]|nr:peptidase [Clostridia bacterium]NCC43416.1 peptidase [Clostridia bacterium]
MVGRRKALVYGLIGVALTAVICAGVILWAWKKSENAGTEKQMSQKPTVTGQTDAEQPGKESISETEISGEGTSDAEVSGNENEADVLNKDTQLQNQESDLMIMSDPQMYTYDDLKADAAIIESVYPDFVKADSMGETLDGRELYHFVIGDEEAEEKIFINGGIHGREYLTSQLVMKQMVYFLQHLKNKDTYQGETYESLMEDHAIHVVVMVNPDGISISQKGMEGIQTEAIKTKVESIALLDGQSASGSYLTRWKANGNGVDLNRNFDALWEEYADPAGHPSSDHYKGTNPGSEMEAQALIKLTEEHDFVRTISYHTQGNVIYWYFAQEGQLYRDTEIFGKRISQLTGYPMDADYENLDPAGYKDWAISKKGIPSLTIEVGSETSPVPPEQFAEIWRRNEFVWEETLLDISE